MTLNLNFTKSSHYFFFYFVDYFEVGNLSEEFISLPAQINVRISIIITTATTAKTK